jgi:hypothetical protein
MSFGGGNIKEGKRKGGNVKGKGRRTAKWKKV